MDATNIWQSTPGWIGKASSWLAERARMRRDAETVARIGAHELRELGMSHSAAAESRILVSECGGVHLRSWIHAEPCFPQRAIRRNTGA